MSDHKIEIVFIINGEDVSVSANVKAPLVAARAQALEKSGNVGRPPEEWEIRTEAGEPLDPHATPESLKLSSGVRLFLTLQVGAGGEVWVDEEISKLKFDREAERLRVNRTTLQNLGCFVTRAEYPSIDAIFLPREPLRLSVPISMVVGGVAQNALGSMRITSLSGRAFGVRLGLDSFDVRPPSVEFFDPWTWQPLSYGDLLRANHVEPGRPPALVLLDAHPTLRRPFLCLRGVREYHEHPQHTGDDWMLYRGSVSAFSILMVIWRVCVENARPNMILKPTQGALNVEVRWEAKA